MSGNTEEGARFKKAFQTVGGGNNNATLDKNPNEEIFKQAGARDETVTDASEPDANSQQQKDLDTKGFTTLADDTESDEFKQLRKDLSK